MKIEEMPAGRKMDALVAEAFEFEPRISWEVLNEDETASAFTADRKSEAESFLREKLERYPDSWLKDYHVGPWKHYKRYSTDIAAAWEVADMMEMWVVCAHDSHGNRAGWNACPFGDYGKYGATNGDTAPLAICRAALKAKGVD